MDPKDFYDALSAEYDAMTDFQGRLNTARGLVDSLSRRFDFDSALDVACGTGTYALALAEKGIQTWGTDLSAAMLQQARAHGEALSLPVTWQEASMENLAGHIRQPVDLILCMGNSLPHLTTGEQLHQALTGFSALLNPQGRLLIQVLNYAKILRDRERIVSVNRQGECEFVRFYDFPQRDSLIHFNLLTLRGAGESPSHTLQTTPLYPYTRADLEPQLPEHGLKLLDCYGSPKLTPFEPDHSETLFCLIGH
jgi:SAM-dependent methyltransferase